MPNRTFIAVASLAAAVCIAVIGFAVWWEYTRPRLDLDSYLSRVPNLELMHVSTKEWMEEHHEDDAGKVEFTRVIFRNGNIGFRFFRADGTLKQMRVTTGGGDLLADLFFSPRGNMVVSGFEMRNDKTMRRLIRQDGDMVETRVFWQDGITLFSLERRKVDDNNYNVSYFHPNGARWSIQTGSIYANAYTEQLYDTEENLLRQYELPYGRYDGWVKAWRADGSLRYIQHYEPYTRMEHEPGDGSYEVTDRGLKVIEEFDTQSRLFRRITMYTGTKWIESVDVFDPQTGRQIQHIAVEPQKDIDIAIDAEVTTRPISATNATLVWNEAEAKVSDMTETR